MMRKLTDFLGITTHPACRRAKEWLVHREPSWRIVDTIIRADEAARFIVAVFYQKPDVMRRPCVYKLFAVPKDDGVVTEIECSPESPYWIRGRK